MSNLSDYKTLVPRVLAGKHKKPQYVSPIPDGWTQVSQSTVSVPLERPSATDMHTHTSRQATRSRQTANEANYRVIVWVYQVGRGGSSRTGRRLSVMAAKSQLLVHVGSSIGRVRMPETFIGAHALRPWFWTRWHQMRQLSEGLRRGDADPGAVQVFIVNNRNLKPVT